MNSLLPVIPSIWGCVEMDAASRDFDYQNYLDFHKRTGCKGAVLSSGNYYRVQQILRISMEESMNAG